MHSPAFICPCLYLPSQKPMCAAPPARMPAEVQHLPSYVHWSAERPSSPSMGLLGVPSGLATASSWHVHACAVVRVSCSGGRLRRA